MSRSKHIQIAVQAIKDAEKKTLNEALEDLTAAEAADLRYDGV
ncbi:MAG: hypothetical protein ACKO0Z_24865 [Betaproteobacteria bacterium]